MLNLELHFHGMLWFTVLRLFATLRRITPLPWRTLQRDVEQFLLMENCLGLNDSVRNTSYASVADT